MVLFTILHSSLVAVLAHMHALVVVLCVSLAWKKPIGWVHIPKTSTAFGYSVGRVNCRIPSDFVNLGPAAMHEKCIAMGFRNSGMWLDIPGNWHPPLNNKLTSRWSGRLVTLIRNPSQWKESYYQDKIRGGVKYDKHYQPGALLNRSIAYAAMAGNQAGYLLGMHPLNPRVDHAAAAMAERKLASEFAFVGVTNFWSSTMCVFNLLYHLGPCFLSQRIVGNAGTYSKSDALHVVDPVDERLYRFAIASLAKQARAVNASKSTCCRLQCGNDDGFWDLPRVQQLTL